MTRDAEGPVSRETRIEAIEAFAETVQVDLPTGAPEKLAALVELLESVAAERGFISPGDSGRVLERHVLDALRAAPAVPGDSRGIVDVGSGAGIPGLPLAVAFPQVGFDLVEPRRARVAFIEAAIDRLALANATARQARIEALPPASADAALARAFAPLPRAWPAIRSVLRPGGRLVFFAGRQAEVPETLPGARSVAVVTPPPTPVLARSGPLIIITAQ